MRNGIRRLLVANRGEIALRVIRSCRDCGIETVIAYSDADRDSLPVKSADRAICIGPGPASQSYLSMPRILTVAQGTGCDAIHPGYGFLSENARFAAECERAGVTFVGPRSETIALLGDKVAARRTAVEVDVPVIPGSSSEVRDLEAARRLGESLGYPLLVKASGGGGGKGLRRVDYPETLERALLMAASEGHGSSDNDAVYIERFVPRARHIEIQIVADEHESVLHLGERECSIQRNYQKLVEESPSPVLTDRTRQEMAEAAVRLARHVGYVGVGTVEFLYDERTHDFYFIEVNTRLQVEHPVTETTTSLDLVELQLRVASGFPIEIHQREIVPRGHAIEFRINAEDPVDGFRPNAGLVSRWSPPEGPWVRVDSHCYSGYNVPPFYDSLLGKVIVAGSNRGETIRRSRRVLAEHVVEGIETSLPFHRWLIDNKDFVEGAIHTGWLIENWNGGTAG